MKISETSTTCSDGRVCHASRRHTSGTCRRYVGSSCDLPCTLGSDCWPEDVEADYCTVYFCESRSSTTPPPTPQPPTPPHPLTISLIVFGIIFMVSAMVFMAVFMVIQRPIPTGTTNFPRDYTHPDFPATFPFPEGTHIYRRNRNIFEWIPLQELGTIRTGFPNPSKILLDPNV